jgi:hypothetical protein
VVVIEVILVLVVAVVDPWVAVLWADAAIWDVEILLALC